MPHFRGAKRTIASRVGVAERYRDRGAMTPGGRPFMVGAIAGGGLQRLQCFHTWLPAFGCTFARIEAIAMRLLAFVFFLLVQISVAHAQDPSPILQPGNAAVAGFSGAKPLDGPQPAATRPSTRHSSISTGLVAGDRSRRMGAPPRPRSSSRRSRSRDRGPDRTSVLGDARRRDAAEHLCRRDVGLRIADRRSRHDGDGRPDRARRGAPNAAFMPGLFGPAMADGGPGSIWRIDGAPAQSACSPTSCLRACRIPDRRSAVWLSIQLAADFRRGSRHRHDSSLELDGTDRGNSITARGDCRRTPAAGAVRSAQAPQFENPAFDSTRPERGRWRPGAARVRHGGAGGRLYYAVAAGLRVWSVAIQPDGSFGSDVRVEVQIGPDRAGRGNIRHHVRRRRSHAARRAWRADRRV